MLAKEIMTTKLVTVREDTPVRELAVQMLEQQISAVPIVNSEGRLLGIVSESDLLRRPETRDELLAGIDRALDLSMDASRLSRWHQDAAERMALLTPRQRQVMDLVLAGAPNKNVAADLGISQRTVESHRAAVMKRMAAKSLPELARLALAASWSEPRNRRVETSF
jgi:DNA-binding CsgD family transcriptional regulator